MVMQVKFILPQASFSSVVPQVSEDEEISGFEEMEQQLGQFLDSCAEVEEEILFLPDSEENLKRSSNDQIQVCFKNSVMSCRTPFRKSLQRVKEIIQLNGESPAEGHTRYRETIESGKIMNYHKILLLLVYKYKK